MAIYTKYCVKLCINQQPQAIAPGILNWAKVVLSPSFYRSKIQPWREEVTSTKQAWQTHELDLSSDGLWECFHWKPSPFTVCEFPDCIHLNSCGFPCIQAFGFLLFLPNCVGCPLRRKTTRLLELFLSLSISLKETDSRHQIQRQFLWELSKMLLCPLIFVLKSQTELVLAQKGGQSVNPGSV